MRMTAYEAEKGTCSPVIRLSRMMRLLIVCQFVRFRRLASHRHMMIMILLHVPSHCMRAQKRPHFTCTQRTDTDTAAGLEARWTCTCRYFEYIMPRLTPRVSRFDSTW